MARRLHAVARGYVQGVGYRLFAAREARRLGLTGWVRNRPDGAVELTAEGEEETLKQLLVSLERGPSEADVSHVEAQWAEANGEFEQFEIRS